MTMTSPCATPLNLPPLTQRQRAVVEFEQWWSLRHPLGTEAAKQGAIRAQLQMSWARYYQVLNETLDHPQAERFDPALVRHLRRLRVQCA